MDDKQVWVDCRCEKMVSFYFYCGKVGHVKKICNSKKDDLHNRKHKEGQFGEWSKADKNRQLNKTMYGRREQEKEKKETIRPMVQQIVI